MSDHTLEDQIRARLTAGGFATLLGFELVSIDDGASEIRLEIGPRHLNPGGTAHGGVAASLLDSAIGLALRTTLPEGASHATLQLTVTYLRPVRPGTITARGTAVKAGSRIEYGEGTLTDASGQIVARGVATFVTRQA